MLIKNIDEWNKIIQEDSGFIFNDFGTQFPGDSPTWNTQKNNKFHVTSCCHVKRMTYITDGKLTKHFFKTKKEAINWLKKNRSKQGYTFCNHCNLKTP